jgi:hypothetical protein
MQSELHTLAVMDLNPLMWACLILVAVLGPLFTLWWWKIGDKWADAEHRRFQDKPDTREKVVMKPTSRPLDPPPAQED